VPIADGECRFNSTIVSSGGVWKTPNPRAGISTPSFNVRVGIVVVGSFLLTA
jgi:hypothetical protein